MKIHYTPTDTKKGAVSFQHIKVLPHYIFPYGMMFTREDFGRSASILGKIRHIYSSNAKGSSSPSK